MVTLTKEDMSPQLSMYPSSPGRRGNSRLSGWSRDPRPSPRAPSARLSAFIPVFSVSRDVADHLSVDSVVYASKRTSASDPHRLPHSARSVSPRISRCSDLSPRLEGRRGQGHVTLQQQLSSRTLDQRQINLLRLEDWHLYNWSLPKLPSCRPQRAPELVAVLRAKRHAGSTLQVHGSNPCAAALSTEFSGDDSGTETGDGPESSRKLPPVGRSCLGQPMLRRPATQQSGRSPEAAVPETSRSASSASELLKMMGNYLDLTPVTEVTRSPHAPQDDPILAAGSADFYGTHYPLLLCKKGFLEEADKLAAETKVVSHRQIQGRQTADEKRRVELEQRIGRLERALTSLEQGDGVEAPDHVFFVTELRHGIFDPRTWPWNADRYQQGNNSQDPLSPSRAMEFLNLV